MLLELLGTSGLAISHTDLYSLLWKNTARGKGGEKELKDMREADGHKEGKETISDLKHL